MSILGSATGGFGFPKTYILTDENGNEFTGVVTGQEEIFDATTKDVKIGKTFASDEGIKVGEDTKTYRVVKSSRAILPNASYSIPLIHNDQYDYTKFQCVIAKFNTSFIDSVAADKVVLEDNVYEVNSIESLSQITKNIDTKSIDLNIVNDTEDTYIIHYFTYKEEY